MKLRSYLGAVIKMILVSWSFVLFICLPATLVFLLSNPSFEKFKDMLMIVGVFSGFAIPVGILLGLVLGSSLKGKKLSLPLSHLGLSLEDIDSTLAPVGYRPQSRSDNKIIYKPRLFLQMARDPIFLELAEGTATVVGPAMYVAPLEQLMSVRTQEKLAEETKARRLAEESERRLAKEEAERSEETEAKRLGDGDKLFSLANKAASAGRSDEAVELFASAIRSNPWKYCGVGRGSWKPAQPHQQRLWLEGMKAAGLIDVADSIVNPPRPKELTLLGLARADKEVENLLNESCRRLGYKPPESISESSSGTAELLGKSIILNSKHLALPWDVDPNNCTAAEFVRLKDDLYVIEKIEEISGRTWVHLKQKDGSRYRTPRDNI